VKLKRGLNTGDYRLFFASEDIGRSAGANVAFIENIIPDLIAFCFDSVCRLHQQRVCLQKEKDFTAIVTMPRCAAMRMQKVD
jgi:hypothetical protein